MSGWDNKQICVGVHFRTMRTVVEMWSARLEQGRLTTILGNHFCSCRMVSDNLEVWWLGRGDARTVAW